jgi:hypothetical protein
MRLIPTHPPGRSTRKARDFETEIVQLREQGYTLEAIRNALADAGVHVTISTVRREANRAAASQRVIPAPDAPATSARAPSPSSAATKGVPTAPVTPQVLPERRSGKDVAEVFMRNRITNPLVRSKEQR